MARIGIIGAGVSGLTLAFLLQNKGHSVTVFERSGQPGGALRTTRTADGWSAEWGPNTIIESSGRIKSLISMLDLEDRRVYPVDLAKKRYIVRDGRMVAVPGSLAELIRTPLLSRSAKLLILREPLRGRGNSTDETLADFVRRRLGEEFLKWPIDALVGGIYAGNPELLSLRHAFPRLALLEEQHGSLIWGQLRGGVRQPAGSDEIPRNKAAIFSFDEGLQVLPEAITRRLGDAVVTNVRPLEISTPEISTTEIRNRANTSGGQAGRWQLSFRENHKKGADLTTRSFDILIYSGTAYGLNDITLPDSLSKEIRSVTEIPHPPVTSLTLGFRRDDVAHPLDGFGVLLPGVEGFPILGTLFTSSLFPDRAPDSGHVTLTTYLGGTRQPEIAGKDEQEQEQLVSGALDRLLGLRGKPRFRHRVHWPKAIPQFQTGHQQFLDRMNRAESEHPGFYMSGNYRTGISVGDTINAAFDLADRIHHKHPE